MHKERKTYCIRVKDQLIEVSREVYTEYYRMRRYEKYLEEVDRANGKVLFSSLEADGHLTEDWIVGTTSDISKQMEERTLLKQYLLQLNKKERWLIEQLILCDRMEADIAMELGISQQAVNRQKHKALSVLRKKIIENI